MLQKKTISRMFPKLFEPGAIGKLWLKNRLIRAAIMTSSADMNGCVTDRVVRHYRESARGGAGIVIVESAYMDDKASKSGKCMIGASRDEHKPGLQWLASTIRASGAIACLQIEHCGRQKGTGTPPVKAPSCIPNKGFYSVGGPPPEELTFEEIFELVEGFGKAAFRAKQVGFDAVEFQGSHGYLITNFLSPHTNKRTDCYGGSLKNRMTFLLEVIDSIRRKVGPDYPLSIRLSGTDYAEDEPITIEETIEVAKVIEKMGLDAIHVSGGDGETIHKQVAPMYLPVANNVWAAEAIKKMVNIPVIASGSITTPEVAEKILEEGKADFVSLARPLLADPYYPSKAQEGRPEQICPCIRCLDGCVDRGVRAGGIRCSVNATLGNEDDLRIARTSKRKKVAVVGGGPAGMEAARVAALAIDVKGLVALAGREEAVVAMAWAVGDTLVDGMPLLRVHGGGRPLPERRLRRLVRLGSERTFEQDPKYAIRILVDIAIKALSPAINDPTTAVQALDQVEDLLLRLGRVNLWAGHVRDGRGNLRLVCPVPKWEDFLVLAFDEIRYCGANSIQVMRRMRALLQDLTEQVPPERRAALQSYLERVDNGIRRTFEDGDDRKDALEEDRQGLGLSRVRGEG